MKVLLQRVAQARVTVGERETGRIGRGFVALVGVGQGDGEAEAKFLAEKTAALRVFPDAEGRMNVSLQDVGGEVLAVSQFTLHADTRKGNRPSFIQAAPSETARRLYALYVECLRSILGPGRVAEGEFQAVMRVELVNDGPVTIELKSRNEYGNE